MSTRSYTLPLETTRWELPGTGAETVFNWDYDAGRDRLLSLYEKGKDKQWNTNDRIDWSYDLDPGDVQAAPDEYVPIFGSPTWEKLSREQKNHTRMHTLAWSNSQFLHGEQGALICSSRIVETVPDVDSKFYAATQVVDEARHVETYSRFLNEKVGIVYPINKHLKALLEQTLTDSRWDITYLGMQVMIEGVALAAFSMFRDLTQHPLSQQVNAYVMQDEARHVAFGRLALRDAYQDLTEKEREEREEFVVEASYLLRDRFMFEEVWEHLGFDVDECVQYVDQAQSMSEFRKALFSRVVPTVKDIGLWGEQVQRAFADMGVLDFQDLDVDALSTQDEVTADQIEQRLAHAESGDAGPAASRADQVADTIAAGSES